MHLSILPAFLDFSRTEVSMCFAGVAILLLGVWAARKQIAEARGLDKILALGNVFFAIPLAVFGALHLAGSQFVVDLVPEYMPWRMFWAYFVGFALIAASISIATRIAIRWSGFLFGIMMFLFVATIHLPGAISEPDRFIWTIVFRELSFGGAGWLVAGTAANGWKGKRRDTIVRVGTVLVSIAIFLFGVEHFLFPMGLPGVPLRKEFPVWVPGPILIDYLTGAALVVTGVSVLFNWKTKMIATSAGGWLLLLVLVIYGPVLVAGLLQTEIGPKIEGINYFADTLLFAGCVLALANATRKKTKE